MVAFAARNYTCHKGARQPARPSFIRRDGSNQGLQRAHHLKRCARCLVSPADASFSMLKISRVVILFAVPRPAGYNCGREYCFRILNDRVRPLDHPAQQALQSRRHTARQPHPPRTVPGKPPGPRPRFLLPLPRRRRHGVLVAKTATARAPHTLLTCASPARGAPNRPWALK